MARAGLVLGGLLMLSACSSSGGFFDFSFLEDWFSGGEETGAAMEGAMPTAPDIEDLAAVPPKLVVGDRFSFDNPDVTWEVKRIEGDRIFWQADSGDEQVTALNPILPALAWRSAGQGQGRRLITDMSEPFFPLRVGKSLTFQSTVSTDTPPYAWEFIWSCEILGTEAITVPAGSFETYRIQCGRQRADELIFSYAPRVGHYVRMVSHPGAGQERVVRELTGFRSRNYIAYVDPMTTAMAEGQAIGDGANGEIRRPGGAGTVTMVPLPPMENPMNSPDSRFDNTEQPMMVVPQDGTAPKSGLSDEGRARQAQSQTKPRTDTASVEAPDSAQGLPGAAVGKGAIALHLASYKNPANAERGWMQLSEANTDLLGAQRPIVRRVDLPGKGIFYRLHAGPVASMSDAKALCAALKARNLYCVPMQL
ncbi:SPOR domain-containing protein [Marivibrio halodurans]|uniref:SPOR domain-containing protein n=1 Tax=Marivibrio halodurans TaxID=2039722 RepID=UPI001B334C91